MRRTSFWGRGWRSAMGLTAFVAISPMVQGKPSPPPAMLPLRVVTLGDSITKGVRPGVTADQTFSAHLQQLLVARGLPVEVINVGIGGERTDQALLRLEREVLARRPHVVTLMYGTNDSYVDQGKTASRLSSDEFRANLAQLVERLRADRVTPVIMTEPRWADDAAPNGLGENPNLKLEPFVQVCRSVAGIKATPIVDHWDDWTRARKKGQVLRAWTTDGCHPNPEGHARMAAAMAPVLEQVLKPLQQPVIPFETELLTLQEHDDRQFLWYHPRAAVAGSGKSAPALLTLQKHLHASDHYTGLSFRTSADGGKTWTAAEAPDELAWRRDGKIDVAVADVTPGWLPRARRFLAIGAQVRYSAAGEQLEDQPRSNQTAYALFDPKTRRWTPWKRLEMPASREYDFAQSGCAQWVVREDGRILVPVYHGGNATTPWSVTVLETRLQGETLTVVRQGNTLELKRVRGLVEPSLVRHQGRYYLTLRHDERGYVTSSRDGLWFAPIRPWTFDDGAELGSYNTQQHWLSFDSEGKTGGLFLAYTRRGAGNDHIIRHRAPLFLAQVDPVRLCVVRATEKVVIPERGGEFGNFGANPVSRDESWITVAEGVWSDDARRRGARGATYLCRIRRR